MALPDELIERQQLAKTLSYFEPQTTGTFQEDLYSHIMQHANVGNGLIEVGYYTGGMTVILGYIAEKLGWPLYVIEVHQPFIDQTKQAMLMANPKTEVYYHTGDLSTFPLHYSLAERPNLIFIDASHEYEHALNDIQSLYKLNQLPYYAAFHDFGLKNMPGVHAGINNINVGRAILDYWGEDAPYKGIGVFNTERSPIDASGCYFEAGSHEGIILDLSTVTMNTQYSGE